MILSRRSLVQRGAATFAGAIIWRPGNEKRVIQFQPLPPTSDERVKALIHTAVEAAMASGASYADARLTFTQDLFGHAGSLVPGRTESMGIGVRVIYDGFWGGASSPVWEKDEAARLGRAAVALARANVYGKPRVLNMAPNRSPQSGNWVMPIKDDPFEMDFGEILDFISGLDTYMGSLPRVMRHGVAVNFRRQQKAFGSSQGQLISQQTYYTEGHVFLQVVSQDGRLQIGGGVDRVSGAGMGFEYLRDQPLRQFVRELHDELINIVELPVRPVDVGRFPVLLNATNVARILSPSVGLATEVDRVMGYEANATGTSYIADPETMLGSFKIGRSEMHVSASRSMPGGISHVKWDDEGVEPREFPIVKDGILVNLQTNREGCGWIQSHYQKTRQPFVSFGCAYAPEAFDMPLVHSADLRLHPAETATSLDTLRRSMDHGVEWWGQGATVEFDFQQVTGFLRGQLSLFEIKDGKRVAWLKGGGMLFRTTELWDNLDQIGGQQEGRKASVVTMKGEPQQVIKHTVDAPPAVFKDMSIVDILRKA